MSDGPLLDDAAWLGEEPLRTILATLNDGAVETRVVGGAVRDALLGRRIGDVDLATTATPAEVTRRVEAAGLKAVPTGFEHGTVTVVAAARPFEVTTLREDVETDGRHAVVRFGTDWTADARRRDFTMNALYLSADGVIHDPLGGYPDALARRVRFIGEPERRIAEDHLRILRFFRFHAGYGAGAPDAAALRACIRMRLTLLDLSAERVRQEMLRLIATDGAAEALAVMGESGILQIVLGGVDRLPAFRRLAALEAHLGEAPDPVRRLAALAVAIPEDGERLGERLRLSRAEARRLVLMAQDWRRISRPADEAAAREDLYRCGPETYADRIRFAAARRATGEPEVAAWTDLVRLPERWTAPKLPVDGSDMIGLGATGAAIGRLLRQVESEWIAGGFAGDRATLLARAGSLLAADG